MPGMTSFLDRMPPTQRRMVLIGVPVVAAFVIARAVTGRSAKAEAAAPASSGTIPGTANPDAIGTGELASFQDAWTDALYDLQLSVNELEDRSVSTPTVAAPSSDATSSPTVIYVQQATTQPTTVKDPEPAVADASAVYGPSPYLAQLPTVNVPGSVQAPDGGVFSYGTWHGDVLVDAHYVMPDGSFVRVQQ